MRRYSILLIALLAAFLSVACTQQEIDTFKPEDSTVYFLHKSEQYSLRGVTDAEAELTIKLGLYGPAVDHDRLISVEVVDSSYNNATSTDFQIKEALVPAGGLEGRIVLKVKMVTMDEPTKVTTLAIRTNDEFKYLGSEASVSRITWSDEYMRPSNVYAWQAWYYFFGPGYSKAYHKLLVEVLGEEIEHSGYSTAARKDPDTIYHVSSWWYAQSSAFYDFVKKHDKEHPDDPYMHSDDYEHYNSYLQAVGKGTKPEQIPTILSTLAN